MQFGNATDQCQCIFCYLMTLTLLWSYACDIIWPRTKQCVTWRSKIIGYDRWHQTQQCRYLLEPYAVQDTDRYGPYTDGRAFCNGVSCRPVELWLDRTRLLGYKHYLFLEAGQSSLYTVRMGQVVKMNIVPDEPGGLHQALLLICRFPLFDIFFRYL